MNRKKYKKSKTTNTWVMVFKVTKKDLEPVIVHISHCARLYTLGNFIFHIFNENKLESPFEFSYLNKEARSYRDFHLFKLPEDDTVFPPGVGNIRNFRIDSAFFGDDGQEMILKTITDEASEYSIERLETIPPTLRKKYPYYEKIQNYKTQQDWFSDLQSFKR